MVNVWVYGEQYDVLGRDNVYEVCEYCKCNESSIDKAIARIELYVGLLLTITLLSEFFFKNIWKRTSNMFRCAVPDR